MIPISEIKIGDLFANPLFVNSNPQGVIFRVEKINAAEKMVLIQSYGGQNCKPIMAPYWKKNTDRMFQEAWRYGVNF